MKGKTYFDKSLHLAVFPVNWTSDKSLCRHSGFLHMLYVEHYRTVSFAYLILRRNIRQASIDNNIILCTILVTRRGRLLQPNKSAWFTLRPRIELVRCCVIISYFWRHPCQLDLSQRHRATRPQSPLTIGDLVPNGNVTRSGRIGFVLGVVALLLEITKSHFTKNSNCVG